MGRQLWFNNHSKDAIFLSCALSLSCRNNHSGYASFFFSFFLFPMHFWRRFFLIHTVLRAAGVVKFSYCQEQQQGFCSAPSPSILELDEQPLYWKANNPTLSPSHLRGHLLPLPPILINPLLSFSFHFFFNLQGIGEFIGSGNSFCFLFSLWTRLNLVG